MEITTIGLDLAKSVLQELLLHELRHRHRHRRIQKLVFDARRLDQLPDIKPVVRMFADIDPLARQGPADLGRLKDEQGLVVMQRLRLRHRALLASDHLGLEIVVQGEGAVHFARVKLRSGKPLVVPRHVSRQN